MSDEPTIDARPLWIWLPILIAGATAAYAAFGHPSEYGFYTFTRWVVTIAAVINAVVVVEYVPKLAAASVLLAIVFNPIFPIHFGRDIWFLLDLAAIPLLVIGGLSVSLGERNA